jgi:hypothetical protein
VVRARLKKLMPERRSEIARKPAQARWRKEEKDDSMEGLKLVRNTS